MGCSQSKTNDVVKSTTAPSIAPPSPPIVQSESKLTQPTTDTQQILPVAKPESVQPELIEQQIVDSAQPPSVAATEPNQTSNLLETAEIVGNKPIQPVDICVVAPIADDENSTNYVALTKVSSQPAFISVSPHVGFVIKTKHIRSGDKIFINVLYHEAVMTPITCDAQTSTDKKGEQCLAYSVVVPARLYQASYAYDSPEINKVSTEAIQLVNSTYKVDLDLDYKIPKMKRGYVGDKVDDLLVPVSCQEEEEDVASPDVLITPPLVPRVEVVDEARTVEPKKEEITSPTNTETPPPVPIVVREAMKSVELEEPVHLPPVPTPPVEATSNRTPQPAAAAVEQQASPATVVDVSLEVIEEEDELPPVIQVVTRPVPPKMHGWLKKQGHLVKNWKSRYFVLDNGYMTYYVDKLDSPPYGRDMKGQLCLAGYREQDISEAVQVAGNGKRTSSSNLDASLWANRIHLVYDPTLFAPDEDAVEGDDQFQALLLEASSADEKNAWLAAIQAHTEYFESTLMAAANPLMHSVPSSNSLNGGGSSTAGPSQGGDSPTNSEHVPMKRSSTAGSMANSRSMSRSPSRQSTYSVLEDKKRWVIFLHNDEELVMTGLAGKPNPVGIHLIRQLILTSRKRLLYIDTKTMELKGEIEWTSNPAAPYPQAKKIDETTFDVVESAKRTYRFICKDSCTAGMWVTAISNTAPPPPAHNKWQS